MKLAVLGAVFCLTTLGYAQAQPAAVARHSTQIAAQDLDTALHALAKQRGLRLISISEDLQGKKTRGASGNLTNNEAFEKLLDGTGLTYRFLDEKTVTIEPAALGATKDPPVGSAGEPALEEIVVTAQKRVEKLQDVPVPVTAVQAKQLVETNQLRLQDYYSMIPGLSVTPADTRGVPVLAIRGVTTGSFNPTVGIMIDDMPYGSTIALSGGFAAPDIDPSDLARLELLRGPQGTLYGASSIGGLLKFVTVDPSTDSFSGHVQGGLDGVHNGNHVGYSARGSVNVPLGDTLAVRASAFTREDPGYIDNVLTGQKGVNRLDVDGGHLAALWRPSSDVSLKVGALFQHATLHGAGEVDSADGLGDLQQSRVRGTGGYDKKDQAYSATLNANIAGMTLAVLSGYSVNTSSDSQDFTDIFGDYASVPLFGVRGTPTLERSKLTKFTQEIRLSGSLGSNFDWLLGGFYTHEEAAFEQDIFGADPVSGVHVGLGSADVLPSTYAERAVFTDLTYRFTDRFDLQVGGRESLNRQSYAETITGPLDAFLYAPPYPVVNPLVHTKDSSFTYLVTPRFKFSPDLMLYARLASGYRPGGPNSLGAVFAAPLSYGPDTTRNYEIGLKGNVFERLLSFDASVYYIDWKDVQLSFVDPVSGAGYFINGSRAKSTGAELSLQSKPLGGLTLSAWIAFNDAELTNDIPPGGLGTPVGLAGDRLPSSSRISSNFSIEQAFHIATDLTATAGGMLSYVGNRVGPFTSSSERQDLPGYAKMDLHAGLRYRSWTVNFYCNNVTDRRGLLTGGLGTINPAAFIYIQPRLVGMSVADSF
jgi:outer membrane receptor protein involved in Fe transport